MLKQHIRQNIVGLLTAVFAIFFFLFPLLRLVIMSLTTDGGLSFDNYLDLLKETRTLRAIGNTVLIAASSTAISVVLGSWIAFLVAYTDIKHKKLLETLTLAPFVIPSYIITLSWSSLLSSRNGVNLFLTRIFGRGINIYSLGGIILMLGICNMSVVYLNVLPLLRKIPRELEWAAQVSGYSIWEVLRHIDLAQVSPAIASGGMLAFLASIDNFSVPAFLGIPAGIPVLSTYIYETVIGFGPSAFRKASVLSVILSLIAITGTALQGMIVSRSSGMESIKEDYSIRVTLKKWRKPLEGSTIVMLFILSIVPLVAMIVSSFFPAFGEKTIERFTMINFQFVFTNRGIHQAFINSFSLSVLACIVCIIIGTIIAYYKVRNPFAAVSILEQSASLTYAIPGIVLALAMIFHWTAIPYVYGTIRILLIAYITRYIILQIKSSSNAMLALDPAMEEAARVSGSSVMRMWGNVILPLTVKSILSGTTLIFMQSLTELTLSSMLAAAGTKTIGLSIFSLQQGGDFQRSTAVSSVVVAIMALSYGVYALLESRWNKRLAKHGKDEV